MSHWDSNNPLDIFSVRVTADHRNKGTTINVDTSAIMEACSLADKRAALREFKTTYKQVFTDTIHTLFSEGTMLRYAVDEAAVRPEAVFEGSLYRALLHDVSTNNGTDGSIPHHLDFRRFHLTKTTERGTVQLLLHSADAAKSGASGGGNKSTDLYTKVRICAASAEVGTVASPQSHKCEEITWSNMAVCRTRWQVR